MKIRLLLLTGCLAACGGTAPHSVPTSHRATADACATTDRPAGNCSLVGTNPDTCSSDSECTSGDQGRCDRYHNGLCTCNYNSCNSDADCASGQLCGCHGSFGIDDTLPDHCIPGNCRVDADCGAGGFCSPSFDSTCGAYAGVTGFYCHTPEDTCGNDSDCASLAQPGAVVVPFCGYDVEVGHWACSTALCAG